MLVQLKYPITQIAPSGKPIQHRVDELLEVAQEYGEYLISKGWAIHYEPVDTHTYDISELFDRVAVLEAERLRWMDQQVVGNDYAKNDVVRNSTVLAVANKDTSESAGLGVLNDQQWTHPESPTWTTGSLSATSVTTAMYFSVVDYVYADRVRFRVSSADANIHYRVSVSDITDPDNWVTFRGEDFTADTNGIGWYTHSFDGRILSPAQAYMASVESWNALGSSITTASYNYTTPNNAGAPGVGDILHASKATGSLRVNKTDNDGTDRSAMLEGLEPGDHIVGAGMSWTISEVVADEGTWMNYRVTPSTQGIPGVDLFGFEEFTEQPIPYSYLPDYFTGYTHPELTDFGGAVDVTGAAPTGTTDSYGIGIETVGVVKSADWDWMSTLYLDAAIASAASGSGAAVSLFNLASHQPYLSVEHAEPYTYMDVTPAGVHVTEWDADKTFDRGGLNWGVDGSGKATIPETGEYNLRASFVVEDGNNNVIGVRYVKNSGVPIYSTEIEVNAGIESHLTLDDVELLHEGDEVYLEVYSDVVSGVNVEVHGASANITQQWVA